MQERDATGIQFIGQQDGAIEREFTAKVSEFLQESASPMLSAYLCRVHYGDPKCISVAVCIASSNSPSQELLDGIAAIFHSMFGAHEHLDMLFLNGEQQSRLRPVCKPFCTVC